MPDLTFPRFYQDTGDLGPGPSSKSFPPSSIKTEASTTVPLMILLGPLKVHTGGDLRGNQIGSVSCTDEEV